MTGEVYSDHGLELTFLHLSKGEFYHVIKINAHGSVVARF